MVEGGGVQGVILVVFVFGCVQQWMKRRLIGPGVGVVYRRVGTLKKQGLVLFLFAHCTLQHTTLESSSHPFRGALPS